MRYALTLVSATILTAGCQQAAGPEAPAQAAMTAILQAAADATGATRRGEILWYTEANLYDYIDGQAEEFREAGFDRLAHSEWQAPGAPGDAYVEVDLYRMASAEAVAKVMVAPPPDAAVELAPGVQAYQADGMCEFGAGRYYVRMTARGGAEGQEDLVDGLARAIARRAAAE